MVSMKTRGNHRQRLSPISKPAMAYNFTGRSIAALDTRGIQLHASPHIYEFLIGGYIQGRQDKYRENLVVTCSTSFSNQNGILEDPKVILDIL